MRFGAVCASEGVIPGVDAGVTFITSPDALLEALRAVEQPPANRHIAVNIDNADTVRNFILIGS